MKVFVAFHNFESYSIQILMHTSGLNPIILMPEPMLQGFDLHCPKW